MKAKRISEDTVTSGVLSFLRSLAQSWWMKTWGGPMAIAGIPDIIGCWRGRFVAIELKAPHRRTEASGGVSPIQRRVLDLITAAGGIAIVAYSVDEVMSWLKQNEEVK